MQKHKELSDKLNDEAKKTHTFTIEDPFTKQKQTFTIETFKHETKKEDPEEEQLRQSVEMLNKKQKFEKERQEKLLWEEEERKKRLVRYTHEVRYKKITYDHHGKII